MKHLGSRDSRSRHADRPKTGQAANALGKGTRFVIKGGVAIRFDFRELIADKLIVLDHASNIAAQERWQRPTITGDHCVKATEQPFANPLAVKPNAVANVPPKLSAGGYSLLEADGRGFRRRAATYADE